MLNQFLQKSRSFGALIFISALCAIAPPVQSQVVDATINSTTFTVDHTAGGNNFSSNWVGTAFAINAPVYLSAYNDGGGNNSVTISNFTITSAGSSYIGSYTANSSLTLLTNTTWNASAASVFISGSASNSLTINGATLDALGLYVGSSGSQNTDLLVTNGGQVIIASGGYFRPGYGGNNGLVTVTGTGSVLRTAAGTTGLWGYWGDGGVSNQVIIANGGKVLLNETYFFMNGADFSVLVTGAGSVWSNSVVSGGGYGIPIGYGVSGDSVIVSNGGAFYSLNYSGYGNQNQVGYGTSAFSNSVIVTGSGSVWSNDNDLLVGGFSGASYNSVSVLNSGKLYVAASLSGAYIGYSGSNNLVTVSGSGSVWEVVNSSSFGGINLGGAAGADGNQLIVSNGATVINRGLNGTGSVTIGDSSGANHNSIQVTGAGSLFTNAGAIYVGEAGANNNSLTIANGGLVVSAGATIGNSSSSNTASVLSGGKWNLGASPVIVGSGSGTANQLIINGGTVTTTAMGLSGGENIFNGLGNSLVVTNGGQMDTLNASYITYASAASGDNSITITGSGSVWSNGGQFFDGSPSGYGGNHITISAGGLFVSGNEFDIGYYTPSNNLVVTGTGSVLKINNSGGFNIGAGGGASNNSVVVSNGAKVVASGETLGGSAGAILNSLTVTGPGSVISNTTAASAIYLGYAASSNSVVVSQGGLIYNNGNIYIGNSGATTVGNGLTVTDSGSVLTNTGDIIVGNYILIPGHESLTVSNGGKIFAGNVYAGGGAGNNALNTTVTVTGTGSVLEAAGVFHLGGGEAGGNTNTALIINGGLLEANTLSIYNGSTGNSISNIGGIYQFTGTPTVTPNSGTIVVDNGTISYRATVLASVATISGMTYTGTNTFMLNAASNTVAAAGSQTYTFNAVAGNPTNYANLVMVNGQTAYYNGNITIGASGSMLISNTTATISSLITNNGSMSFVNATATFQGTVVNNNDMLVSHATTLFNGGFVNDSSLFITNTVATITGTFTNNGSLSFSHATATFQSQVYNGGAWITDPTTNIFNANYVVGASGSIVMSPGDVMIFKSNLVNQSTQSNTFNTAGGTFVFAGISLTQTFATAGIDYGPGGHNPAPDPGDTNMLYGSIDVPSNNFQLGTLDIANGSTVEVSSALSLLPGERGALYVDNLDLGVDSLLIISNDVTVYFHNSNDMAYASSIDLLAGAEFHQLVPEPSSLLLWMSGFGVLLWARKRKKAQSV